MVLPFGQLDYGGHLEGTTVIKFELLSLTLYILKLRFSIAFLKVGPVLSIHMCIARHADLGFTMSVYLSVCLLFVCHFSTGHSF